MSLVNKFLSGLSRLGIVVAILIAFAFGLATTVYLSLRSPEVTVPGVVGKDRFAAENELQAAGLNFRVRATRPSRQVNPDTVMFQVPPAGQVVKQGQTVAVDVARVPREGEAQEATVDTDNSNTNANTSTANSNNVNENKPKRRPANANANANANGNTNSVNGNRNANTVGTNANVRPNANVANSNSTPSHPANANRPLQTDNSNANRANRNVNRPPRPIPTPERRR